MCSASNAVTLARHFDVRRMCTANSMIVEHFVMCGCVSLIACGWIEQVLARLHLQLVPTVWVFHVCVALLKSGRARNAGVCLAGVVVPAEGSRDVGRQFQSLLCHCLQRHTAPRTVQPSVWFVLLGTLQRAAVSCSIVNSTATSDSNQCAACCPSC
jgi:hypothetical protein